VTASSGSFLGGGGGRRGTRPTHSASGTGAGGGVPDDRWAAPGQQRPEAGGRG
jgi:hypothetical protein